MTGATGHIGTILTDSLLNNSTKTVDVDFTEDGYQKNSHLSFLNKDHLGIEKGNLPNRDIQRWMVENNDVIFHVGGAVLGKSTSLAESLAVNSFSTAVFVQEAKKSMHRPRIIYSSTIAVYELGNQKGEESLGEDDLKLNPDLEKWVEETVNFLLGLQSSTLKEAESNIESYLKQYPLPQKTVTADATLTAYAVSKIISERILQDILRLFLCIAGVYGPGYDVPQKSLSDRTIHKLFYNVLNGEDMSVFDVQKNFVYVGDVVKVLLASAVIPLERFGKNQRILNVGAAKLVTTREIAKRIAEITGSQNNLAAGAGSSTKKQAFSGY